MIRPISEQQIKERKPNGNYVLELRCTSCREPQIIELLGKELFELQTSKKLIQQILQRHPPATREMFLSGICPPCWTRVFGDSDSDDE